MTLPNPVKVSPLIKSFRWGLLIGGIFYGSSKRRFLAHREIGIRAEEERKKVIRDAKLAEERRITSERDIAMLGKMLIPD